MAKPSDCMHDLRLTGCGRAFDAATNDKKSLDTDLYLDSDTTLNNLNFSLSRTLTQSELF